MKKNKLEIICMFGIIASIVLFCTTSSLQVKNGYARDAGIYVSTFISNGLWILMGVCIVSCIAFFALPKLQNKSGAFISSILLLAILIIYGLTVNIGWKISFDQAKNTDIQYENLTPITLDELQSTIQGDKFQIVYIGRDNCPLCEYIMPDFITFLETENLKVLYYNTKYDRDTRTEEMREVLDSISVYRVPFTMILENQEIIETFEGEHMVDELKAYFVP